MMNKMSHSQILGLLPQNEEMIVRLHQRQQERYRQALEREKREAGKWNQNGVRAVRKPDGTHMKFRIPKLTYIMWQKKLGDECWDDAGFVHDFLRDNPQFRVTSIAENPTVGWTPGSVTAKRYRQMRQQAPAPDKEERIKDNGLIVPPKYQSAIRHPPLAIRNGVAP